MHGIGHCGGKHMQRIVEVCLLILLCGGECSETHGYALGEKLREFGFDDSEISVSTLYRTLRGMEEAGWVKSRWEAGGPGPQRREYEITDEGRAALDEWAAVLTRRRERITNVLEAYALLGRQPMAGGAAAEENAGKTVRPKTGPRHGAAGNRGTENKPERESPEEANKKRGEAENLNEYWD